LGLEAQFRLKDELQLILASLVASLALFREIVRSREIKYILFMNKQQQTTSKQSLTSPTKLGYKP
jgi:hypothetical protein